MWVRCKTIHETLWQHGTSAEFGMTLLVWLMSRWCLWDSLIFMEVVLTTSIYSHWNCQTSCCIRCDWLRTPVVMLKEVPGHCFSYFYETEYRIITHLCHPQGKVYFQALSALLCSQRFGNWKKMFFHLNLIRMKNMQNGGRNCFEE